MNSVSLTCSQTANDHEHSNADASAIRSQLLSELDASALFNSNKWNRQPENASPEMTALRTALGSVSSSREQRTESVLNTSILSCSEENRYCVELPQEWHFLKFWKPCCLFGLCIRQSLFRKAIQRVPERRTYDDFGTASKRFGVEGITFGSLTISTSNNNDMEINEVISTELWNIAF